MSSRNARSIVSWWKKVLAPCEITVKFTIWSPSFSPTCPFSYSQILRTAQEREPVSYNGEGTVQSSPLFFQPPSFSVASEHSVILRTSCLFFLNLPAEIFFTRLVSDWNLPHTFFDFHLSSKVKGAHFVQPRLYFFPKKLNLLARCYICFSFCFIFVG